MASATQLRLPPRVLAMPSAASRGTMPRSSSVTSGLRERSVMGMEFRVLLRSDDLEVLDPIVERIAVAMVDVPARRNIPIVLPVDRAGLAMRVALVSDSTHSP